MHAVGFLLIAIGGVMEGLFAIPLKLTPRWSWENTWLAGSFAAFVLIPWPLALVTVPDLAGVYASAPYSALAGAIVFGFGWGLGGVFYGLGISRLGISLGTSLIMGLIAVSGSILPALIKGSDLLKGAGGATFLAGIAVMICGLAVCAYAGNLKISDANSGMAQVSASLGTGVFYCVAAGLLSSLVNFALLFGEPIAAQAISRGANVTAANNAVWAIVFTANYFFNMAYCLVISKRNRTITKLWNGSSPRYWVLAMMMGLLWAGGIVVYGRGAAAGGSIGPIFGFPIMLMVSILTGNAVGAATGEWTGQSRKARLSMALGVIVMLLAIALLGCANYSTP